jgi:2-methylisocitrate lyase-like PEP mutase family enzyme
MAKTKENQTTWKRLLDRDAPLLLPAAHDALTAKLIERAGFEAYQVGGFALNGARHAFPDLDLTHFGEEREGVRDTIAASALPVLIDADDGYGDVKNVTRTTAILGPARYEGLAHAQHPLDAGRLGPATTAT